MDCFSYDNPLYDSTTAMSIIDSVDKITQDIVIPSNAIGDKLHPSFDSQSQQVILPEALKKVYDTLKQQGITSLGHPSEYGGGDAPQALLGLIAEILLSGNSALAMCHGLTSSAILCLTHSANETLKSLYLNDLVSGKYSGTMCLTEPQCGTDLGLIKTKASILDDHYQLTGHKIWITFGEHNLTDNIIHLVLARLPDAPEGIKGISLFLVPKFLPNGQRNNITCGGLEEKMGIHASPTCVMNLDQAEGWLVGEPHKGMRAMFVMMNDARIYVGIQALALSEIAYQTAIDFAKQRRQSRSLNPDKRDKNEAADIILTHPDVRRMLLTSKSTNEAMRALIFMTQQLIDQKKDDWVSILTPIIKSYITERSNQNISTCLQSMGGSGYVRDWNIEQYFRDARITMIYEGTNGIQALDLIGRKLPKDGGKVYREITQMMRQEAESFPDKYQNALHISLDKLDQATQWLMKNALKDPEAGAGVASAYLNMFALTLLSYCWGKMVKSAGVGSSKDKTGLFFIEHELISIDYYLTSLEKGNQYMMNHEQNEW